MSVEALREPHLIAKIGIFAVAILVSLVVTIYLWVRFTLKGNIYAAKTTDLNVVRERLLTLGAVALPALFFGTRQN